MVRATVSMLHGSVTARRTVRTSRMNETAVSDKLCLCYCFTIDVFLTTGIIEAYLLQKSSDENRPILQAFVSVKKSYKRRPWVPCGLITSSTSGPGGFEN